MSTQFHAHGKLLISGEYLVLRGASALAVPLKVGQWMEIEELPGQTDPVLDWRAMENNADWFSAVISIPGLTISQTSDPVISGRLIKVIRILRELNTEFFSDHTGYRVTTRTSFVHTWGLGSSSALILNLARWAKVDPFELSSHVSAGSGYDVAAAISHGPILYTRTNFGATISPVRFSPSFRDRICFAYLGNKQDSGESMDLFDRQTITSEKDVRTVSAMTLRLLHSTTLGDFLKVMAAHELFLSRLLRRKRIKEEFFPDFEGEVKSLGAWGGDFFMAASPNPAEYIKSYLADKGIHVVFGFDELILS